jgi:hypothetical protein
MPLSRLTDFPKTTGSQVTGCVQAAGYIFWDKGQKQTNEGKKNARTCFIWPVFFLDARPHDFFNRVFFVPLIEKRPKTQ